MDIELEISSLLKECNFTISLIWADGITPSYQDKKSSAFFEDALSKLKEHGYPSFDTSIKERVRKMIRHGKYKPSGRSKPASEFLLNAAQENRLSPICPPVDINNIVSLSTGLPGSIFDFDKTGNYLLLRRGEKGESYIFNSSGQTIDLEDLLVVCKKNGVNGWQPCGNPVKDSMETKISVQTTKIVAVLYIPKDESEENILSFSDLYVSMLKNYCEASQAGYRIVKT